MHNKIYTCLQSNGYCLSDIDKDHTDKFYATVTAVNGVGLDVSAQSNAITVDDTPPEGGVVIELPGMSRIYPNNVSSTVMMNRRACANKEGVYFLCQNCFNN